MCVCVCKYINVVLSIDFLPRLNFALLCGCGSFSRDFFKNIFKNKVPYLVRTTL